MSSQNAKRLTVDIDQLRMWIGGELLHYRRGRGIIVNERECEEAVQALERGESVVLRRGHRLTGTMLVERDGQVVEVICDGR